MDFEKDFRCLGCGEVFSKEEDYNGCEHCPDCCTCREEDLCENCKETYDNCKCLVCDCCGESFVEESCECGNCSDCCICGEKETEQEYNVWRPEVHHTLLKVKAKSPEEALELAKDGEESEITDLFEFSHIPNTGWKVEDEKGNLLLDE